MKLNYIPGWQEEIDKDGLKETLLKRLRFHGGFHLSWLPGMTGVSQNTLKKHLDRLVEAGIATKKVSDEDFHYRFVFQEVAAEEAEATA